jgi:methylmalonyl-CoA/ethylmalonyl-CoA epimerase
MDDLAFHHLGVACRAIDADARTYYALGYRDETPTFEDPIQGIRGRFLVGAGPRLELLEPLAGSKVLDPWLERGVKIYHQAFEVPDLDASIERVLATRARLMVAPVPAVAFGGRRIAFVMLSNMTLIELIEAPRR